MNLRQRVLSVLASAAVRAPGRVIAVSAVVAAVGAAVLVLMGLDVETSRVDLWPEEHPLQERFQEYQDLFGSPFQLIVVVEGDDPAQNKEVAARIAAEVSSDAVPEVRDVFYRVDLKSLKEQGLLFLKTQRLEEMARWAATFTEKAPAAVGAPVVLPGIVGALERANQELEGVEDGDTASLSALGENADELFSVGETLLDELGAWLTEEGRDFDVANEVDSSVPDQDPDGFMVADGGRIVLLFCQPRENDDDLRYLGPIVEGVRAIAAKEETRTPGIQIGVTGLPAFSVDELAVAHRDLRIVTLVSAIGVLLLFFLAYGSLRYTAYIALTLLLGVIVDLALASVTVGHVNLISSLFVAVLLGLAIDYGIQLINRFQEELRRGSTPDEGITAAVVQTGEGVLTGGVTTAVAFFTMALGEFAPLVELGVIAGAGILLILASSFLLLPSLIIRRARKKLAATGDARLAPSRGNWLLPVLPLRGRRAAGIVVGLAALVTILLALPIRPISFSNDQLAMLPPNAPSVRWLKRLERTGMFTSAFNASIASSPQEVRERTEKFLALDTVSRVLSLETFLPRDIEAKRPHIRAVRAAWARVPQVTLATPPVDVPALREALGDLLGYLEVDLPFTLGQHGYEHLKPKMAAVAKQLKALLARIEALPAETVAARLGRFQQRAGEMYGDLAASLSSDRETVEPGDLPPEVRGLFFRETKEGDRYLLRVYPSGEVQDDEFTPRFLAQCREVDPDITGYPVNFYEFALVMQSDFRMAFLYAVIAIVLLLLLDLRRKRDLLLALVPLAMGSTWMVGAMNLLGMDYNLANIMAIPLIVGIGVAYGVYVIHRVREATPPQPRLVVGTTGKAVVFSALTTMVSFGAMSTASHRGAASLGLTLLLGIGFCLIASVVVLPALVRLVPEPRRHKGKKD